MDGASIQPGSPPATASAAAPADDPEGDDVPLTSRAGLLLDAEEQATWERLLDRPPRDLPDIRALLDMPAPLASDGPNAPQQETDDLCDEHVYEIWKEGLIE